jgi:hypothetical protein
LQLDHLRTISDDAASAFWRMNVDSVEQKARGAGRSMREVEGARSATNATNARPGYKITLTGPESGFELTYRKRVCGKANDCFVKRTAKNGDSA